MSEVELIKNPFEKEFYNLISSVQESFYFTCPYIKSGVVNNIVKNLNNEIDLKVLTSMKIPSFKNCVSHLSAIETLSNIGKVKNIGNLHAKIYIFDKKKAFITSSNLTYNGLNKNFEYGVLLSDEKSVLKVLTDFNDLYFNKEVGTVTSNSILGIQKLLDALPKIEKPIFKKKERIKIEYDFSDKLDSNDKIIIQKKLSGWKKEIFNILDNNFDEIFELKDLYIFEKTLFKKFPKNNEIKPKIRQILQQLRDLGLIEFIDSGFYRRLW
jgi:phosphatidylserine/phosphatidylglycerophosphate/cardiolipin synthase-like enzyme